MLKSIGIFESLAGDELFVNFHFIFLGVGKELVCLQALVVCSFFQKVPIRIDDLRFN